MTNSVHRNGREKPAVTGGVRVVGADGVFYARMDTGPDADRWHRVATTFPAMSARSFSLTGFLSDITATEVRTRESGGREVSGLISAYSAAGLVGAADWMRTREIRPEQLPGAATVRVELAADGRPVRLTLDGPSVRFAGTDTSPELRRMVETGTFRATFSDWGRPVDVELPEDAEPYYDFDESMRRLGLL